MNSIVKNTLLVACLGVLGLGSAQAQIILTATGGTGATPLELDITTGGTFTASGPPTSSTAYLVIGGLFADNTAGNAVFTSLPSASIGLDGKTASNAFHGTLNFGVTTFDDFTTGSSGQTFSTSDSVVLSAGSRSIVLGLNHTAFNDNGTAFLTDANFAKISDDLTWSRSAAVPEPSTYAASQV